MPKKELETSLLIGATPEFIARRILLIRGQKVMLDSDLAELYQVATRDLNKAVKRNTERFPGDFMITLNKEESENLKFQFGTSSWGGTRKPPHAFTELGVAMLSSILNSDRAVQMNIFIMRAFVKLREMLATHADLAKKMDELEGKQKEQGHKISDISAVMAQMLADLTNPKDALSFQA